MAENIHVIIRFRKSNPNEVQKPSIKQLSETELEFLETVDGSARRMTFDRIFGVDAQQEDLYNEIGKPTVENVLRGYNGTVMAYGQTGSGKTHSMLGPGGGNLDALIPKNITMYRQRGLIPRIVEDLFIALLAKDPEEVTFTVTISVFELYMEGINDLLLLPGSAKPEYRIREDSLTGKGIYVENLVSRECKNVEDVYDAMKSGILHRKTASTLSNDTSSRSHCLTCIHVDQIDHTHEDTHITSRLNLVDLAGSEKVGKTGAEGQRLKEAQMINLSLTLLGNVIFKLTDGKSVYIPYRDSKLTRILQESFGGNSRTTLLCNCAITTSHKDETASTLSFAARAKMIQNKPRVNRELSTKELQVAYLKLLEENRCLVERVTFLEGQQGGGSNQPGGDVSQYQEQIASLHQALTQLKAELLEKESAVVEAKNLTDFHRKKAQELDAQVKDLKEKLKREQQAAASWIRKYNEAAMNGSTSGSNASVPPPPVRKNSISRGRMVSQRRRSSVSQGGTSTSTPTTNLEDEATPMTGGSAPPPPPPPLVPSDSQSTPNPAPEGEDVTALKNNLAEALRMIEDLKHQAKESSLANQRLNSQLEDCRTIIDTKNRDLDSANRKIHTQDVEIQSLKAQLQQLQSKLKDAESFKDQIGKNHQEQLQGVLMERDRLTTLSKQLQEQRVQLEYCEIAEMELIVKSEDIEMTDNDVTVCEARVLDAIRMESMLCEDLHTVLKLIDFFDSVLTTLRRQPFGTHELEGRRSRLIKGFASAHQRCIDLRDRITAFGE